jgi:hypothetical protein
MFILASGPERAAPRESSDSATLTTDIDITGKGEYLESSIPIPKEAVFYLIIQWQQGPETQKI